MRKTRAGARTALAVLAAATVLGAVTPAAADAYGNSGWEAVPGAPSDIPAGVLCAFPLHLDFPVDLVKGRVLATYVDGTPKQIAYNGPLIVSVTNINTGTSTDVNASGSAVVDYQPDGTQIWHWGGPVVMGFRVGYANNHPAGLYWLTGNYSVELASTGRTVIESAGTERDLCAAVA
jgi:hypothetical protein